MSLELAFHLRDANQVPVKHFRNISLDIANKKNNFVHSTGMSLATMLLSQDSVLKV